MFSAQTNSTSYPLSDTEPLAIDLYCGLGGWAEGFLSEGYRVIGFDIERHDYGTGGYPGELVIQDVRTLHGSQFKDAAVIVASPPCQAYSYRAMPWKRAKALPPPNNTLFNECFRIQREACEAAGRHIPLIVENVRGAQKWVGHAKWHFGSYYIWGDVPALMPITFGQPQMKPQEYQRRHGTGSWFAIDMCSSRRGITKPEHVKITAQPEHIRPHSGHISSGWSATRSDDWLRKTTGVNGSRKTLRRAASAQIAKIPFPLAQHIARVFKPVLASLLLVALLTPASPQRGNPMFVLSEIARKRYAQFSFDFQTSVTRTESKSELPSEPIILEPGALPPALDELAKKFRPFIDRVLTRLSEAERKELNLHFQADYRQSWICLSFANQGLAEPFVSASYQMYGIHPDKVWERIVADRKERLGAEYYDWYDSADMPRSDVPRIPPSSAALQGQAAAGAGALPIAHEPAPDSKKEIV